MTNPRLKRLMLTVPVALAISLMNTSCSTTGNNDGETSSNSELSAELASEELDQPSGSANGTVNSADHKDSSAAAATSGEPSSELSLDDAGGSAPTSGLSPSGSGGPDSSAKAFNDDDEKLTKQLANEELNDNAGFDLGGDEGKNPAPKPPEPLVSNPTLDAPPAENMTLSPPATAEQVSITNLKYISKKDGGTVLIETSAPASYHTREVTAQNQVVIEIENAVLPEKFKRPYNTKDFNQSIVSLNAYQEPGSSTANVVVQFKTAQHPGVQQNGKTLTIAANGSPSAPASKPDDEYAEGSGAVAQTNEATFNGGDSRILPSSATDPTGFENVNFYGRPISIEVSDTPVRAVINMIAELSGANIVLAGEVDGNISLKLREVPWDQALLIVMKTRGLGYVRQGSILRVAPYESLQKEVDSARRVAEAQKAAEPLRVKVIPVGYAKVDALEKQISPFLTKGRGQLAADIRTNSLIITDTIEVLNRITNLVKAIDTPPLQVLIEGKVVEAREVFQRTMGINWGWSGQDVDLGGGKLLSQNVQVSPGANTSTATGVLGNFSLGTLDVLGDLNASLRLFEAEDVVHIISSPRVVVLNNEPANIVQGTNVPIPTTSLVNGQSIQTFTYQAIDMKLDVTPQVTSESDIILQIDIKRDFAGNQKNPPDINKREAKTKVLVRNGQTAVVGGVYQSDTTDSEDGVPWLKKLPVFGWLFKQKSVGNSKSEMLVFLTPRILNAETALQKENTL